MIHLIAHRGNNNHSYKENTKEALLECLNTSYISGVELDTRITKDKKFVIFHNPFIVLDNNKIDIIRNIKLKELLKQNIGTHSKKVKIPTLVDFLSNVDSNKVILIEIKEETKNYKETVKYFSKIIKKYSYLNIYVCSFNYDLIKYLKLQNLNIKLGILIGYFINENKNLDILDFLVVTANNNSDYLKDGKELIIWGFNKDIKKIKDNSFIITDKAYTLKDYTL